MQQSLSASNKVVSAIRSPTGETNFFGQGWLAEQTPKPMDPKQNFA